VNRAIDFVIPWVDGNDTKWQEKRSRYDRQTENFASADARFRDMGTLKYVLRSIENHCPWYGKIYLITEGHIPQWLDIDHEKIVHIDHDSLFRNPAHLPTFNSSAIEMNLSTIETLSERFVYMNDDLVIWKPVEPERFFKDDLPVDFFAHRCIPRGKLYKRIRGADNWVDALNNAVGLINTLNTFTSLEPRYLFHPSYSLVDKIHNALARYVCRKIVWLQHWHHPQPYLKSTLTKAYELFSDAMQRCSANRFRSSDDVTAYLYRYLHLATGAFHPYKHNDGLVDNIDSLDRLDKMLKRLENDPHIRFVCFNDSAKMRETDFERVKEKLTNVLQKRFPHKASFEK
jgi:hypothetical protein